MSVVLEGSILEIGERFLRESEGVVPTLYVSELKESPSTLTVKLLARYRFDLPLFFQEMVSKWLYPGKRFPLETFSSCKMDLDGVSYQYIEGVIKLESMGDYIAVEQNLPVVKRELELGLRSLYHARQILELKGITNDEKLFFMQDKLTRLVHRFPERFDYDIFSLLQKFVLSVSDEYKRARSYHALLRIVYVNYSLFQKLLAAKEERPEERHLYLKVTRVAVDTPFGQKNVLGLFIGLNFLKENEFFEKRHLLKAVKKYFPGAHEVADSFFAQSRSEEKVKVLYMEIEKESGEMISDKEKKRLEVRLNEHLSGCIESLVRPLFMPRNEEEVMKYVVTLAHQLKTVRDLPQIVIMFDEQTDRELLFTVALVRPIISTTPPLEGLFGEEVTLDKVKQVGWIRKKFPKEAAIIRFRLPNGSFLRDDFAVDLYKARQRVVATIQSKLGEIRDYNGGMIAKEIEAFFSLKEALHAIGERNEYLMENFFHALYPAELRVIAKTESLKTLYRLFQKISKESHGESFVKKIDERSVSIAMKLSSHEVKEAILEEITKMQIPSSQLLKLFLPVQEAIFLGFIFFSDIKEKQDLFLEALEEHLRYN